MRAIITHRDLSSPSPRGGVAFYYYGLRRHLVGEVKELTVGSRRDDEGVWVALHRIVNDYRRLWKAIEEHAADIVQVNPSLQWKGLPRDAVAVLIAKVRGRKVVVFLHGWNDRVCKSIRGPMRWLFLLSYRRSDAMIVLSDRFASELRAIGYKGPIYVESTLVESELVEEGTLKETRRRSEPVRLLFLATIREVKGIFVALNAFQILQTRGYTNITLTVAGKGPDLEKAKRWVEKEGINNISFLGFVTGKEKRAAFFESDIYLFPTQHGEGMPLSLLEAMAFGLPVVVTQVGGISDFFKHGVMGYTLGAATPEDCAEKVASLIDNPGLRGEMGRYNIEFAQKFFMADTVAKRIQEIWKSLINGSAEFGRTYKWTEFGGEMPSASSRAMK